MPQFKSIAVFCGSGSGNNPQFTKAAQELGTLLAQQNITLVYGGSKFGLMGAVADACLQAEGKVIGVIPDFLGSRELAHTGLTELITVKSMHERKTIMHQKSEAVLALPGGFGTLEELFEMVTWSQLGIHKKPMGVLNVSGYYQDLANFVDKGIASGLIRPKNHLLLLFNENVQDLLAQMQEYVAPPSDLEISADKS
jgi:uncharacterized protein (TIGR00730 family)